MLLWSWCLWQTPNNYFLLLSSSLLYWIVVIESFVKIHAVGRHTTTLSKISIAVCWHAHFIKIHVPYTANKPTDVNNALDYMLWSFLGWGLTGQEDVLNERYTQDQKTTQAQIMTSRIMFNSFFSLPEKSLHLYNWMILSDIRYRKKQNEIANGATLLRPLDTVRAKIS